MQFFNRHRVIPFGSTRAVAELLVGCQELFSPVKQIWPGI